MSLPAFRRAVTAALASILALTAAVALESAPAAASTSPNLSISAAAASKALTCSGSLTKSGGRTPVLFIHGTTSNPADNWSWNWNREFNKRGWAYCNVALPANGTADIQVAAEYVVSAIRTMHSKAHRKISIVGHSQGGMIGRWALKYWPDTRTFVDDYVGLASSNHGSVVIKAECLPPTGCNAAQWQQSTNSKFLTALNSGPQTWSGISYTEVATVADEIVVPFTSTWLPAAANVTNTTSQALCGVAAVEHFGMAYDNAAWKLGLDALTHPGPAKLARISRTDCLNPLMPGVDPSAFALNAATALAHAFTFTSTQLTSEPALKCYATRKC